MPSDIQRKRQKEDIYRDTSVNYSATSNRASPAIILKYCFEYCLDFYLRTKKASSTQLHIS